MLDKTKEQFLIAFIEKWFESHRGMSIENYKMLKDLLDMTYHDCDC